VPGWARVVGAPGRAGRVVVARSRVVGEVVATSSDGRLHTRTPIVSISSAARTATAMAHPRGTGPGELGGLPGPAGAPPP
jgi:hypothetical protein